MELTEREQIFLNRVTDEPKMFYTIQQESGIDYQEAESIAKNLQKKNKVTIIQKGFDFAGFSIQKKQPFKPLSPEDKDRLLETLLNSYQLESSYFGDTQQICRDSKLTEGDLNSLFPQFQRYGLLEYGSLGQQTIAELLLRQEAADYYRSGGFTFEETILKVQLQKLFAELHELEKSKSWEKLGTVMNIVANLTDVISKFRH